jgi:uncharacterized Zn finger protein (UPF0148 family)
MQDFDCPRCGQTSTYDPWKGSAYCPECGYTPPTRARTRELVPRKHRATHQSFLDELLAHWDGSHTPDQTVSFPPAALAVGLFRDYQRAMGEDPHLHPGAHMGYVRKYHPQPDEMASFVRGYLLLKRGKRAAAAQQFHELTKESPNFVDPWIWLTATTDDAAKREAWLERAVILEPAHPLAQDALAILKGRVLPKSRQPASEMEHEMLLTDCPQCGGPMHYEAGATEVVCEYCGCELHLPRIDLLEEKARLVSDLRLQRRYEGHTWAEIQRIVHCKSCGAQLTMTHHLVRTCLYCGSTNVIVEDSRRTFEQPDGFLPFEINAQQATDAISEAQRSGLRRLSRWLTGKEWHMEELQGIYVPFWVFDGFVEVHTWTEEVFPGVSSAQRDLDVNTMMFSNLMFPAVDVPPSPLLGQVFPFDLRAMVPYEPRLVADTPVALYTLDVEVVVHQAYDAMIAMAREKTGKLTDIGSLIVTSARSSSDTPLRVRRSYQVSGAGYQLVLLPLWLARLRSEDGRRPSVVNGQTGQVAFGRAMTNDQ